MNDVLSTNQKEPFDGQCFEDVSNVQYNIAYDDYFDMNDDNDLDSFFFFCTAADDST